jgi:hypothetical protein
MPPLAYGHSGGRGSSRVRPCQSPRRVGEKTSMTTAPFGPALTSCGTSEGMFQVAPAPRSRYSSPTRKLTLPLSTIPSCSLAW